jgi:hypothetical protein
MKYSFLWSAVWSGADYDSFSDVVMRYSAVEENRFRIFLLHLRIGNDVSMGFPVIRQRLF